jgi:hypothetical protein
MKWFYVAACVAIVALAIYVIGGDYLVNGIGRDSAFNAECDKTVADVQGAKAYQKI